MLVTALINTYNHERYIARALASAVEQDFPAGELEIVAVDDGSTDGTFSAMQKLAPRVRCIHKKNGGQVSAFHAGVAEARGEIVAFLDGDDWWGKDKIARVVEAFEANAGIAAIGHGYYEVDEKDEVRGTWLPTPGARLNLETPEMARQSTSQRIFLGTSRLAMRREALMRALPVPEKLPFFDNFIFSQAIAIGGALLLAEPLCYYRVHSGSLYAAQTPTREQLRTRCNLLSGLLESLPPRLKMLGASDEAIAAFLDFDQTDLMRLKLILNGGWPWETFRVERISFRQDYENPDWRYRLFKKAVLLSTLLMPPRQFYRMRQWYAECGLGRWRERLGKATLTVPQVVREPAHNMSKD